MYVPMLSTLESIFKSQHIAKILKNSGTGKLRLREMCDGSLLKTHPLFSTEKHTVQSQMFYDDAEVANPLGSKRGIHKLGAIYSTLRNFSPNGIFLANIHLCTLFHAQDFKRYGFSEILAPIVRDIKVFDFGWLLVLRFHYTVVMFVAEWYRLLAII